MTIEGWCEYAPEVLLASHRPEFDGLDNALSHSRGRSMLSGELAIRLARGAIDLSAAEERIAGEMELGRLEARELALRLIVDPHSAVVPLAGYDAVLRMKRDLAERDGGLDRSFFHDSLLYAGPLPVDLMRRSLEDKLAALEEDPE